jgi:hypothetical protein
MDEHVVLYFLEKYKSRKKMEDNLIEFLATLKYYSETWERAKIYAQITGFKQTNDTYLHVPDRTGTGARLNDGEMDECDVPYIDMYLQEFILHGYSLIKKEAKNFTESSEGFTYLRQQTEDRISSKLLTFVPAEDMNKWGNKIRRNVKKIKATPLDDYDTDYVDIDVLLRLYIEEFALAKHQL